VFVAYNIQLGDLSFDSDVLVSSHVGFNTFSTIVEAIIKEIGGHVRLETNTMDWTSSILEVFDEIVQTIGLLL